MTYEENRPPAQPVAWMMSDAIAAAFGDSQRLAVSACREESGVFSVPLYSQSTIDALTQENARLREYYEASEAQRHAPNLSKTMQATTRLEAARAALESKSND